MQSNRADFMSSFVSNKSPSRPQSGVSRPQSGYSRDLHQQPNLSNFAGGKPTSQKVEINDLEYDDDGFENWWSDRDVECDRIILVFILLIIKFNGWFGVVDDQKPT